MTSLKDRVVIITGAGGQVCERIAIEVIRSGGRVILTSRSHKKAGMLAKKIGLTQDAAIGLSLDLSSQNGINDFVKQVHKTGWIPSSILSCARNVEALEVENGVPSWENWLHEYTIDVISPYYLAMAFKEDLDLNNGSIVIISSIYGVVAVNPNIYPDSSWVSPIHYSTAKAAQIHLTKELAVRFAPNIRVNCISFGGVGGRLSDEFSKKYGKQCPSGRMLEPCEIGKTAVFLMSDGASGITGHNLVVDGGWSIW